MWLAGTLVVGYVIGAVAADSNKSSLENEVATVKAERDQAEQVTESRETKITALEGLRARIVSGAEEKAATIIGSAKTEVSKTKASVGSLQGEVNS